MTTRRPCIGVFDSGFGGLTVLKELVALAPEADYLYFGDTARLPYGSKSAETVAKYAVGAVHYLEQHGAQMLVIACNTATALALDKIIQASSVPLVEEGWAEHTVAEQVARIYLDEAFADGFQSADVLVLGCTHYPLLKPLLRGLVPTHV